MTEADWLAAMDPEPMLAFLRWLSRGGVRKPRLFAVACCRMTWDQLADERSRRAVEAGELYADGLMTNEARRAATVAANRAKPAWLRPAWAAALAAHSAAYLAAEGAVCCSGVAPPVQAGLLRELYGSVLFRPVVVEPAVLDWQGGVVRELARAAYDDRRLPEGALDPARLAVLADALEEAGCGDAELLGHLRGPGPHVRGCWAVDLLLGKS